MEERAKESCVSVDKELAGKAREVKWERKFINSGP